MGAHIRAKDWAATSLGPPDAWPQALRTTVRILLTTHHPIYIFWGPDLICFYNDAYARSMGAERTPDRMLGARGRDVWPEIWDIIGPQIDLVMSGKGSTWFEDALVPMYRDGVIVDVYWTYSYSPIDDEYAPNGVGGVLVLCHETTEKVQAEAEVRESEARFRLVAESAPVMLWMGDESGNCLYLNHCQREFWGVALEDVAGFSWSSSLLEEDAALLYEPFSVAMRDHKPFSVQARFRRADGAIRTLSTDARPRFSATGAFLGMIGVNIDITEELEADAHRQLLMHEVNHRAKNLLAVVQSVARQTAKHTDASSFSARFSERLSGLAVSHDLLVSSEWRGVDLAELAALQMGHLKDLIGVRLFLDGAEVQLQPAAAQAIGMSLHELATNSAKYGALSGAQGHVNLSWRRQGDQFAMEWRESGGPLVTPPERKGFGQTVIVDMARHALNAQVALTFEPTGVVWTLEAPLAHVIEGASA